jgi:hemerythrin superfamily protein
MNAIDMLKAQHRQVERLFDDVKKASGEEKQRLFFELADTLAIHTTIEERHFYPAVRSSETEDLVEESYEEHTEANRTLADLLAMKADDRSFGDTLGTLEEQITNHVGEEEDELFPKVATLMRSEQLEAIGEQMSLTAAELIDHEPRNQVSAEVIEDAGPLH